MLTAIVATVMPDAVFYFKILGGLLVCPLAFLLPAILYWKLKPHDAFNVFLMGIGIIMALVGFACVGNTVAVDILGFKTS